MIGTMHKEEVDSFACQFSICTIKISWGGGGGGGAYGSYLGVDES